MHMKIAALDSRAPTWHYVFPNRKEVYRDDSILDTWIFQAVLPWGSSLNQLITCHLSCSSLGGEEE